MTILRTAIFALALTGYGCAAVVPYLPMVIAAVQDGMLVLDGIQHFVDQHFQNKPDADLQKKVAVALARTRSALDVAVRTASGEQKLDQAKVDEAFADFRRAYTELMALLGPLGVQTSDEGRLRATPGGLLVPSPLALRPIR